MLQHNHDDSGVTGGRVEGREYVIKANVSGGLYSWLGPPPSTLTHLTLTPVSEGPSSSLSEEETEAPRGQVPLPRLVGVNGGPASGGGSGHQNRAWNPSATPPPSFSIWPRSLHQEEPPRNPGKERNTHNLPPLLAPAGLGEQV